MAQEKKKKKKRKLSAWNIFIKENSHLKKFKLPSGSPDLKALSRAFKLDEKVFGSKSKPKKKTTKAPTRRVSTTSRKPTPKKRPKGERERQVTKLKKEYDDWRRALGATPKQSHFKMVGNQWSIKAGKVKAKRVKLSEAMKIFRQKARKRL